MAKRGGLGFEDPNAVQENDFWEDKTEFTPKPQTQSNQVNYQYQYPSSHQPSNRDSYSRNPHHQNNNYNRYNNNNNNSNNYNNNNSNNNYQQRYGPKYFYRQPPYHPPQDAIDNPYSGDDEEYMDTPLVSPIPPPRPQGRRSYGDRDNNNNRDYRGDRDRDRDRDRDNNRDRDRDNNRNRDWERDKGGDRDRERGGDRENRGWKREGDHEDDRNKRKRSEGEYNPTTSTSTTTSFVPSSSSSSETSFSTSPSHDDYPSSTSTSFESDQSNQPSDFAKKYMEKIGWKEGKGLGKTEQGIVEPIASSDKIDKRGLGFEGPVNSNFTPQTHHIDMDEFYPHDQTPEWIQYKGFYESKFDWSKGMKVEPIDVEPETGLFCDPGLVQQLFNTKSRLDGLDERAFFNARKLANPYEMIGKGIFQNRAAMKMANLDQMFQLTTADPENTDPNRVDHIDFADVCAGPGGFTEYVMWRKEGGGKRIAGSGAHGYGFTLAGPDDWKLEKFSHDAPTTNFRVDYGVDGKGDVLNSDNIRHFAKLVHTSTHGKMLEMMMADGGISVEGDENNQETKLKQLVMCQFLMMFNIVAKGGKFVCKLFDCFTPFTVGLLYLLYRHFEKICVLKPHTSRPANSERYVVCFNKLETRPAVTDYLFEVNGILNNTKKGVTVTQVVDPKDMDDEFVEYITKSNTDLVKIQITALERLFKYVEDTGLMSVHQGDIKKRCMEHWDVPLYRTPREGPSYHPRRVNQPVSYARETPAEMKSIKQQEADLLNKHKQGVYSSDWRQNRHKTHDDKPKDLRESQDGVVLLEGFLAQSIPRQSLPPPPESKAVYKEKLLATMEVGKQAANPSSSSSSSSSSAPPTHQTKRKRPDSAFHARATRFHPYSHASHAPAPHAPSRDTHEQQYTPSRRIRRPKVEEGSKEDQAPPFDLKDPKILAALQKYKATAKQ